MITIKGLIEEDFINYKKPQMFIAMPRCTFKCGKQYCQNSETALAPDIEIDEKSIVKRYIDNPITESLVLGGLEPFDTFDDLFLLVTEFRKYSNDDIVIYTGYEEAEISDKITILSKSFSNIIIKFGRFIPNKKNKYDQLLNVNLSSDNQYSRRIS